MVTSRLWGKWYSSLGAGVIIISIPIATRRLLRPKKLHGSSLYPPLHNTTLEIRRGGSSAWWQLWLSSSGSKYSTPPDDVTNGINMRQPPSKKKGKQETKIRWWPGPHFFGAFFVRRLLDEFGWILSSSSFPPATLQRYQISDMLCSSRRWVAYWFTVSVFGGGADSKKSLLCTHH